LYKHCKNINIKYAKGDIICLFAISNVKGLKVR